MRFSLVIALGGTHTHTHTHVYIIVQQLSRVWLYATPWTAACQASLSITNPQSLLKLMSIKSVMPSNHLILCCPLLLLPSIFPSIRVFSNQLALHIRWPKYSASASGLSMNIQDWLVLSPCTPRNSRVFSSTIVQNHQLFYESSDKMWSLEKEMANHFSILALRTPWAVWKCKRYDIYIYIYTHV